jgi:hypothetical protein
MPKGVEHVMQNFYVVHGRPELVNSYEMPKGVAECRRALALRSVVWHA